MDTEVRFGSKRRGLLLVLAFALSGVTSLSAHDMWIEPTAFLADSSKVVGLRLRVGQDLLGDPLPRDPALFEDFFVQDAAGRKPVPGRDGADPAGLVRLAAPGLSIVGYFSRPSPVSLTAAKFNQYLTEEGLDAVAAERVRRGASNAPAREVFTRCAKTLIASGAATDDQRDRAVGLTLELVAGRNPYALAAGDELPVQLLYHGQPLGGALVVAINRASPSAKVASRTDASGRVRLRLPQAGMWLVKSVHMVPAPSSADAEWASFWASLTFELKSVRSSATDK